MDAIKLKIGDFLGFCDLNGIDAITSEQVQSLEEYIRACNEAQNNGDPLVPDAIWDKLMSILRKVAPESELCKYIWEGSVEEMDDSDDIVRNNPMFSIMTVKSFECDELKQFIQRLPEDVEFDAHASAKLNGHGIRLKYRYGVFFNARSRARSSAGRDITKQLKVILERDNLLELPDLSEIPLCEIRGEWVLPFENMQAAREYNSEIKSAFSGVSSMGRDSASESEWGLLRFVAYELLADDVSFDSKSGEYELLEELGFETPVYWQVDGYSKDNILERLKLDVADWEEEVKPNEHGEGGYAYYTDGVVFSIDRTELFRSLGDDGSHYKYGNIALKVGYWEQNMLSGVVQTIMWTKGKSKLSPVAIVADEAYAIEWSEEHNFDGDYCFSKKEIANWEGLGVLSQSGNKVRRIPLYEPNNIVILDAYPGQVINFRYGGEAGVIPCFEDGTPLTDGKVREMLQDDTSEWEDGYVEI